MTDGNHELPKAPSEAVSPSGINHLVLNVRDIDESHKFWTEIVGMKQVGALQPGTPERPRPVMRFYSADHDGKLEATECRNLMQKVNWARAASPEQREKRFKTLDRNEDGKLGPDEFQGGPARFKQLDRNGDGFLSRDEVSWLNPGAPSAKKTKP